jgi:DNA-binding CsgD family transcriptional regulator
VIEELSARRRELMVLKANGYTNAQAAQKMGITKNTAESMIAIIIRQYGAENITHAASIAIAIGDIGIHEISVPEMRDAA